MKNKNKIQKLLIKRSFNKVKKNYIKIAQHHSENIINKLNIYTNTFNNLTIKNFSIEEEYLKLKEIEVAFSDFRKSFKIGAFAGNLDNIETMELFLSYLKCDQIKYNKYSKKEKISLSEFLKSKNAYNDFINDFSVKRAIKMKWNIEKSSYNLIHHCLENDSLKGFDYWHNIAMELLSENINLENDMLFLVEKN